MNVILGIIAMWVLVVLGISLPNIGAFIDIPSVQIVVLGTIAGAFASFPLKQMTEIPTVLMKAFTSEKNDPIATIKLLVEFAEKARKEGILGLENSANKISDEFLKKGINLAVDGTEPELIKQILITDIKGIESRHEANAAVFEYMASLAPGMGMIGTLIGLVIMLGNLSDVSSLGPSMAVALITTMYGSLMANCIFTPLSNILVKKSQEEILIKDIMVQGIMAIQAGDNPRIVEMKLAAAIDPVSRTKVVKKR